MALAPSSESIEWFGPGAHRRRWRDVRIGRFLLSLFIPPKGQKVVPTKAGLMLSAISMFIGIAGYNSSSNILFITLSLLLSAIVVSGLLSWLNFRSTAWRMILQPPFRAGERAVVDLEVFSGKRFLPTYSLGFGFRVSSGDTGRLSLGRRLDPGETRRLQWSFTPRHRGRELIEMTGVSSQFPFGFLYKQFGGRIAREVHVWPARIAYASSLVAQAVPNSMGDVLNRAGSGNDFINLREYRIGDSYRQVHWKASARQRRLMVRQLLAENHSGFFLQVDTSASVWSDPEQFEKMCSLAATLAEDLFRQGQLIGAIVNDCAPFFVRRVADLELLLDQLAVIEPVDAAIPGRVVAFRNVIVFAPDENEGVSAYVRGQKAATA
ncbi:MAG: DUF58 domain-containing protein [Verrucomicrobia bacterium]|nr:MAG: DUF58 domain-containing protein [Verrucomicrobiota bacterium]